MNINRFFIWILFAPFASGCALRWDPPPQPFERWEITGKSLPVELVIAHLLECGQPGFYRNSFDGIAPEDETVAYIRISKCMEAQGFVESSNWGSQKQCKSALRTDISRPWRTPEQTAAIEKACDPATPAPKPSVEKRLNSPYCKTEWASKFAECQPIVDPTPQKSAPGPVVIPLYDDNRTWKLDEQTRQHNNQQMNQMHKVH